MLQQIKNRFTDAVMFEVEIDAKYENESLGIKLGAAVKVVLGKHARANLARANLAGANLAGANLARANLAGANLAGANLAGANLSRAYLSRAYLAEAYLAWAYLAWANLAWANLDGVNLDGANLDGANLDGANLSRAYLAGANLDGKKLIGERPIIQIGPVGSRATYLVAYITDGGLMIKAGCFFDTIEEFSASVNKVHADNKHGKEYAAAIEFIRAHAAIWTPDNKGQS